MKTEQINIRLKSDLAAPLDRLAREEALDRATAIRRLLETSIKQWELEHALRGYQTGELSVGRAAEEAGLTHWELIDAARLAGIPHPPTGAEGRDRPPPPPAGRGLTDLVKRPTASAAELGADELADGIEMLRAKIGSWRPGLVLFAFREPAARLLGGAVAPGPGPELDGIPTFLLSGPYAPRAEAARLDAKLRALLGK